MRIPDWTELTDSQRRMLTWLASSFGCDPSQEREKTESGLLLPTEREAFSIALEMYTISRMIIVEAMGGGLPDFEKNLRELSQASGLKENAPLQSFRDIKQEIKNGV